MTLLIIKHKEEESRKVGKLDTDKERRERDGRN